jgi:hypothetical protein
MICELLELSQQKIRYTVSADTIVDPGGAPMAASGKSTWIIEEVRRYLAILGIFTISS